METHKFPWFMFGLLVGVLLAMLLCASQGQAQSYVPGEGGLWRQPNLYDSGGVTFTPQGPVYDYGVPKYEPVLPSVIWFGILGGRQRAAQAQQEAAVEAAIARAHAQTRANCLEIVRINKFLETLGGEPTVRKGVCDGME